MTVFGSHGRVRTEEFNAGDVGYVPQGYAIISRISATKTWNC